MIIRRNKGADECFFLYLKQSTQDRNLGPQLSKVLVYRVLHVVKQA